MEYATRRAPGVVTDAARIQEIRADLIRTDQSRLTGSVKADVQAEDPVAAAEAGEVRRVLATAVAALPSGEQTVVTFYYYEHLTLAEIGRVLGVTESRVCQLHTKSMLQLRALLADLR
jgi:RNA polymerase sigma factor (sigma-70 family)